MICITKALYRGHLDRIVWERDSLILHFCRRYCMDTLLVTGLCGYKFAEHKLTNGSGVTLEKKLIRPMLMADIS